MSIINSAIYYCKAYQNKRLWRKENQHNHTAMGDSFNRKLVKVGNGSYGMLNVVNFSDNYELHIGHYCSIGPDVLFIVCGDHYTNRISTYPFRHYYIDGSEEAISKGNIVIEDDVWIGARATILSGVTVGKGSILSAGTVVTHNVPPYSIIGGVPGRVIKMRFKSEIMDRLSSFDYSKVDRKWIESNIKHLYEPIENKEDLDWLEYS